MATTITPIANSQTPYSIQYLLAGDVAGAGLRSVTQLLADLDEGPLKQTLRRILPADVDHLNVDGVRGSEIRIYNLAAVPADAAVNCGAAHLIRWVGDADPAVAGLECTLANLETIIIEIRLNHSTQA